jgi:hypothetical protein
MATTAAPATPWLSDGAGDTAAQSGPPRLADYVNGGWQGEGAGAPPPVLDHITPATVLAGALFELRVYGTYAPGATLYVGGAEYFATEGDGYLSLVDFSYPDPGSPKVYIRNADLVLSNYVRLTVGATVSAHTTQAPASPDLDNGAPITRGCKYTFDADGSVASLHMWVPTTNTGVYTLGWYAVTHDDDSSPFGAGTLLTSVAVVAEAVAPDGWARVPIAPQSVLAGHTYAAACHSSSGRYVATAAAFATAGISNAGVNAIATGSDPNVNPGGTMRNGTYNEGPTLAYPGTVAGSADYFVDVGYAAT